MLKSLKCLKKQTSLKNWLLDLISLPVVFYLCSLFFQQYFKKYTKNSVLGLILMHFNNILISSIHLNVAHDILMKLWLTENPYSLFLLLERNHHNYGHILIAASIKHILQCKAKEINVRQFHTSSKFQIWSILSSQGGISF